MPAPMDLSEAIFASINAIRVADTGFGGLAEVGGLAFVNRMVQRDDPNYSDERADYWPQITVDVIETSDAVWGAVGSPSTNGVLVRMTIRTQRDPSRPKQNSVSQRARNLYDGSSPGAQSGWFPGILTLERVYQLRAQSHVLIMVHEYSIRAGSTVAELVGRQSSITFSGSEGDAIGTTMLGRTIDEDIELVASDVTYFDDQAERLTRSGMRGTITVSFTLSSMTPVIPIGAQGTLVVYEDTVGGKSNTYEKALVVRRRFTSSTDGDSTPNKVYITFRVSASGTTPIGVLPIKAA